MKKYKILENIAIADVAFSSYGETLSQLFENSAEALISIVVDLKTVQDHLSQEIKLSNQKIDLLLFDFLNEIIFIRDTKGLIFSKFTAEIKKRKDSYELKCKMTGEKINYSKHKFYTDVKAITLHMFYLKKINEGWEARVVVDI